MIADIGYNMSIGATVSHVLVWYGKDIIEIIKKYKVSFSSFLLRVRLIVAIFYTIRRVKFTILI